MIFLIGRLSLPKTGPVTLQWTINSSSFSYQTDQTMTTGQFSYMISPDQIGSWLFQAIWPGDETTNPVSSNPVTITVTPISTPTPTPDPKPSPSLTLTVNPPTIRYGDVLGVTATFSLPVNGTARLDIKCLSSPSEFTQECSITNGYYNAFEFFNLPVGTWQFSLYWPGDETSSPSNSNVVIVIVTK